MSYSEIVDEISRLSSDQQIELHGALSKLIIEQQRNTRAQLIVAARALFQDYRNDAKLTEFTTLDSDDFHGAR